MPNKVVDEMKEIVYLRSLKKLEREGKIKITTYGTYGLDYGLEMSKEVEAKWLDILPNVLLEEIKKAEKDFGVRFDEGKEDDGL